MSKKRGPSFGGAQLGIIKLCRQRDLDSKQPRKKWCLYSKKKPKKVLGRHPSRKAAHRQEVAIKISQRRRARVAGRR